MTRASPSIVAAGIMRPATARLEPSPALALAEATVEIVIGEFVAPALHGGSRRVDVFTLPKVSESIYFGDDRIRTWPALVRAGCSAPSPLSTTAPYELTKATPGDELTKEFATEHGAVLHITKSCIGVLRFLILGTHMPCGPSRMAYRLTWRSA